MKFLTQILILYTALASSISFVYDGSPQKPLSVGDEALKVPGENPLYVRSHHQPAQYST